MKNKIYSSTTHNPYQWWLAIALGIGFLYHTCALALSLDSNGFRPNVSNTVYSIHVQSDGRHLLAGKFDSVNTTSRKYHWDLFLGLALKNCLVNASKLQAVTNS
jgi:hypothetical protein